jgi:hypothetical protein
VLQRGRLVLHASAVAIDGQAVAFLGDSGWGKSTTAAALHARGHPLVADDVAVVEPGEGRPVVVPAFPRLRLWPDAAAEIGLDPAALPRVHSSIEKRAHRIADGFADEPLPLGQIYVLAEGPALAVEWLEPHEAMRELARHAHGSRAIRALAERSHFLQCARVARHVPIGRLKRPPSLEVLPALVELVEEGAAHDER